MGPRTDDLALGVGVVLACPMRGLACLNNLTLHGPLCLYLLKYVPSFTVKMSFSQLFLPRAYSVMGLGEKFGKSMTTLWIFLGGQEHGASTGTWENLSHREFRREPRLFFRVLGITTGGLPRRH